MNSSKKAGVSVRNGFLLIPVLRARELVLLLNDADTYLYTQHHWGTEAASTDMHVPHFTGMHGTRVALELLCREFKQALPGNKAQWRASEDASSMKRMQQDWDNSTRNSVLVRSGDTLMLPVNNARSLVLLLDDVTHYLYWQHLQGTDAHDEGVPRPNVVGRHSARIAMEVLANDLIEALQAHQPQAVDGVDAESMQQAQQEGGEA